MHGGPGRRGHAANESTHPWVRRVPGPREEVQVPVLDNVNWRSMNNGPADQPCRQSRPEPWSSPVGSASSVENGDRAEPQPELEPELHSGSSEEEDAAAAAERQRWMRARSIEWQQARAIISRRSSEEASGSESGGGSSMSDVFSSSAGSGAPVGNRLTSESESDWSSAHEGFFVETAGDMARMRILELQHKGVDLPAYDAFTQRRGLHATTNEAFGTKDGTEPGCRDSNSQVDTHCSKVTTAETMACGPAGESTGFGAHRHLGRPRRRVKVLSKEQKQLKRLRRRKRELEAMVSKTARDRHVASMI